MEDNWNKHSTYMKKQTQAKTEILSKCIEADLGTKMSNNLKDRRAAGGRGWRGWGGVWARVGLHHIS